MIVPTPTSKSTAVGLRWALLAVLWLMAAGVGFVGIRALSGGGGGSPSAEAAEVVALESFEDPGVDAFTPSVTTVAVEQVRVFVRSVSPQESTPSVVEARVTTRVGNTPGLYGGTGDRSVCDAAALVAFLGEHPAEGEAWAKALSLDPAGIETYVASLTPVVLTADTMVTNHGFAGGVATPRQAVLQAGTAVMVDRLGVPRVKCACGNPLLEPSVLSPGVEFEGDRWEGFDEASIVGVEAAPSEQDAFEVAALDGSGSLTVEPGSFPSVTEAELRNATLPGICGDPAPVTLVDGVAPGYEDPSMGFAGTPDRVLGGADTGASVAVGDFDGRPGAEGAMIMACNTGGNMVEFQLFAFRAGPELIGEVPWTDGLSSSDLFPEWISHLVVQDGWLAYEAGAMGPDDAYCCPSVFISRRYRLDGSAFVAAPSAEDLVLSATGLGPATAGMTYAQVAMALGREVDVSSVDDYDPVNASCTYLSFSGSEASGQGGDGIAASFEVFGDPTESSVTTSQGIALGSTLDEVLAAYPTAHPEENIYQSEPDYYVDETVGGQAMALRFVFDDTGSVRGMMGGLRWAVELQEGCL